MIPASINELPNGEREEEKVWIMTSALWREKEPRLAWL
jgi:hypothetical protein